MYIYIKNFSHPRLTTSLATADTLTTVPEQDELPRCYDAFGQKASDKI